MAGGHQLKAGQRFSDGGDRVAGLVVAGFQPGVEFLHEALEDDLAVQVGFKVIGDDLEERSVAAGPAAANRGDVGLEDPVFAVLQSLVGVAGQQKAAVDVGREVPFEFGGEALRHAGQHHGDTGTVTDVNEPAERSDGGDVASGNGLEVQQDADGPRVRAQGASEAFHQQVGAAEEDVATELVGAEVVPLQAQDAPIGDGTHPAAVAVARGELGLHGIRGREPEDQQEDQHRHPDAHARQEAEEGDRQEDQHDDRELRPGQPAAHLDQPLVQHDGAGEQEDAADQGQRNKREDRVAEQQRRAHEKRGEDAGQPRVGAEPEVAQGDGNDDAAGGTAAESGGHRRETHGAELPVPVQLHVAGEFEAAEVDHETEKADQDQGQDVGDLSGHRRPVDETQPTGIE